MIKVEIFENEYKVGNIVITDRGYCKNKVVKRKKYDYIVSINDTCTFGTIEHMECDKMELIKSVMCDL